MAEERERDMSLYKGDKETRHRLKAQSVSPNITLLINMCMFP